MSNKEEKLALCSPCDGEVIKLEDVCDDVFSSGMLGVGFAVIPDGKDFFSPARGRVTNAHEASHAYMIESEQGLEILVHIGINTVELEGEYFSPLVKENMTLYKGDKLTYADVDRIMARGYDPVTVIIVTNSEKIQQFTIKYGKTEKGQDVMEYTLK